MRILGLDGRAFPQGRRFQGGKVFMPRNLAAEAELEREIEDGMAAAPGIQGLADYPDNLKG